MLRKLDLHEPMGVPQIWLLDPADPVWQRYENGRLVDRATFSLPERGIGFEMNEMAKLVE